MTTDRAQRVETVSSHAAPGRDLLAVLLMRPATLMTALRLLGRRGDAAGRPQALFELQQLAHEVQIRADDRPRVLHQLVRFHHGETFVPHYVRDRDRRTT